MSDVITFYHNPYSRGRIAHWMLEEVGVPYEIKILRFDANEQKSPEYLAINPMGKVPTIVHRGTVVTEAAAICAYLADAFPEKNLAPKTDDPARGTYYRWLFFGAGCIEPALADKLYPRTTEGRPLTLGHGTYDDVLNTLETAITKGRYILDDQFSAADVYVGSEIGWGLMAKTLEPRPTFQAYVGRLSERPAFQRALQKNNELGAALKAAAPQSQ